MKRGIIFIALLIIILLVPCISAEIKKGNITYDIEKEYIPSSYISGWINISIINATTDLLVYSNLWGNMSLFDFLDLNSIPYDCFPEDCSDYYTAKSGATTKPFSLTTGQEKILAIKITGNLNKDNPIEGLSFDLEISNEVSCTNPLEIDIGANNEINWRANKVGTNFACFYGDAKGCFDSQSATEMSLSQTTSYCEKIKLPASKSFLLGAWVRKVSGAFNNDNIEMSLYDLEKNQIGSCYPTSEPLTSGGEISCNITLDAPTAEPLDYYVCVKGKNLDTGKNYKIKGEETGTNCGFFNEPDDFSGDFTSDYYIFAKAASFENIGNVKFDNNEFITQNDYDSLDAYITEYLDIKYNTECKLGCTIPIKFKANTPLTISFSNLSFNYLTTTGEKDGDKNIYDVDVKKAKISTPGYETIDLDILNLTTPSSYGNKTIDFYIGNDKIFSDTINILKFPVIMSVYPKEVSAATPTTFYVIANATDKSVNIINYTWYFGDGTILETTTNKAQHTYTNISGYELTITVTDKSGLSSEKTFTIIVGSPKEAANYTLQNYKKRVQTINSQISKFPTWQQNFIKNLIKPDNLTSQINILQLQYNSAQDDKKYVAIMNQLMAMKVPYQINTTSSGSFSFYVDYTNINPSLIATATQESLDKDIKEEDYQKAVASWEQANIKMNLNFNYITAYYSNEQETLLSAFKLKIEPITSDKTIKNFLIIENAKLNDNFVFSSTQSSKQDDESLSLSFDNLDTKELEFAFTGQRDFVSPGIYLSPKLSSLDIITLIEPCNYNGRCDEGENSNNCRVDCKPWGKVILLWIIILFTAFIVYLFIAQWYKINYESHLFKNRSDIYNLLNFISTAMSQNLTKQQIKQKLKESGWNSEQISYVFNKFEGRNIIPLDISNLFVKKPKQPANTTIK